MNHEEAPTSVKRNRKIVYEKMHVNIDKEVSLKMMISLECSLVQRRQMRERRLWIKNIVSLRW